MNPAVSVAIPARNEERYIGTCIQSLLESARMAGVPIEIVVALNRCTDRTREVAESLGARCVVEDAKCIAAVRNAAVHATTAPYVVTVDADSRVKPGAISSVSSTPLAIGISFAIPGWSGHCCKARAAPPRTASITTWSDDARPFH